MFVVAFWHFPLSKGKANENVLCIDVTPNELIFTKIASQKIFRDVLMLKLFLCDIFFVEISG